MTQMARIEAQRKKPQLRDEYMAENMLWVLNREGDDSKALLWAHNGHVALKGELAMGLGAALRTALGDQYMAIGQLFDEGSYTARGNDMATGVFTVKPLVGSLEHAMARAGLETAAIDLRTLPEAARSFAGERRYVRDDGAMFSGAKRPGRTLERFDAVIFTRVTMPTHLMPTGVRGKKI